MRPSPPARGKGLGAARTVPSSSGDTAGVPGGGGGPRREGPSRQGIRVVGRYHGRSSPRRPRWRRWEVHFRHGGPAGLRRRWRMAPPRGAPTGFQEPGGPGEHTGHYHAVIFTRGFGPGGWTGVRSAPPVLNRAPALAEEHQGDGEGCRRSSSSSAAGLRRATPSAEAVIAAPQSEGGAISRPGGWKTPPRARVRESPTAAHECRTSQRVRSGVQGGSGASQYRHSPTKARRSAPGFSRSSSESLPPGLAHLHLPTKLSPSGGAGPSPLPCPAMPEPGPFCEFPGGPSTCTFFPSPWLSLRVVPIGGLRRCSGGRWTWHVQPPSPTEEPGGGFTRKVMIRSPGDPPPRPSPLPRRGRILEPEVLHRGEP